MEHQQGEYLEIRLLQGISLKREQLNYYFYLVSLIDSIA